VRKRGDRPIQGDAAVLRRSAVVPHLFHGQAGDVCQIGEVAFVVVETGTNEVGQAAKTGGPDSCCNAVPGHPHSPV